MSHECDAIKIACRCRRFLRDLLGIFTRKRGARFEPRTVHQPLLWSELRVRGRRTLIRSEKSERSDNRGREEGMRGEEERRAKEALVQHQGCR